MKIGFRTSGLRSVPLQEALEGIREAGYDSVEFCMEHPEASHDTLEHARRCGLFVSAVSYHGKKDGPEERKRLGFEAVSLGDAAGVDTVVFGSPAEGAAGFVHEAAWLHGLCREKDMKPAWETEPGTVLDTLSRWHEIIEPLGPLAGINLDAGHLYLQSDLTLEKVKALAGRIHHVHVEDIRFGEHVHLFPGRGDFPWRTLIECLDSVDYTACLTLDLFTLPKDWANHILRANIALRGLLGYH